MLLLLTVFDITAQISTTEFYVSRTTWWPWQMSTHCLWNTICPSSENSECCLSVSLSLCLTQCSCICQCIWKYWNIICVSLENSECCLFIYLSVWHNFDVFISASKAQSALDQRILSAVCLFDTMFWSSVSAFETQSTWCQRIVSSVRVCTVFKGL